VTQFPSLTVLGLTLLGLTLRLSGIGRLDFWYDEIVLRNYSLTGSALYTPTEPPLMAWLLYGVMSWTRSADAFVIHSVAAVLGTLAIPLAFVLAVRVSGSRTVGMVAALLTAMSPMAIYYSREARPYALLILVSTGLYWAFLRANDRNTLSAWVRYAVVLCLCSLTHLLTIQIGAALVMFALAQVAIPSLSNASDRAGRFAKFAAFSLAAGAAGSAWFIQRYFTDPAIQANQNRIFGSSVYRYGVLTFVRDVVVNLGPGPVGPRFAVSPGWPEVFGSILLALFVVGLWQLHRQGQRDVAVLCGLLIAVPLVIEYATLGEKSSWDWMRWMSHVVVPYLVVVGIGAHAAMGRLGQTGVVVAAAGLALILAPHALRPAERPDYQLNRDVATYLQQHAPELRGVVIPPVLVEMAVQPDQRIMDTYYYHKRETLPVYVLSMGRIRTSVLALTRGHVTELPREGGDPLGELESGPYAVLTRRPSVDCATMLRSIHGRKAVARRTSAVMPGLTICDVEFGAAPN